MPSTHERNVTGIKAHAQEKSQDAKRKVDEAIQQLLRNKEPITFHRVATLSGVAKSYLYTNSEVRDRIEVLRQAQSKADSGQRENQGRSAASRDVLLAAKDRRIQELEAANRRLEAEKRQLQERLKVALGKVYEQR